ncbi:helix-turn-helix domain-containing protein [Rothia aerolata]|uniref:Transcriptional regulator n=1 Tax=Rothia aerolata TaxID=1812262 RepID=A0A917IX92_9MICC|nr:helix-turn-helix domain-containing protein [Rothia aerolata]GGH66378.1 transcriptional regulator [Rothia aerolata]
MKTLEDLKRQRPVNREKINAIKEQLYAEVRAHQLKEIRKAQQKTQVELAESLHVSQNRISRLEKGDINRAQVETIRKYVESLGGTLNIEAQFGDTTYKIA